MQCLCECSNKPHSRGVLTTLSPKQPVSLGLRLIIIGGLVKAAWAVRTLISCFEDTFYYYLPRISRFPKWWRTLIWPDYWYKMQTKSSIFWDLNPCSLLKVNRCSGGPYRLHFQGWRVSQARNQHEAGSILAWFTVQSWISQKTEVFITTAVRISKPKLHIMFVLP
jgi:hypothetical protein